MNLLVIRHAIAMDRQDYQVQARAEARQAGASTNHPADDDFRPLTEEGQTKMRKNARGLKELVGRPDILVTSPLTRALQTAEILRQTWKEIDLATSDELRPGSEPAGLARWLKSQPQCEAGDCLVAIVGHEPHLSSLVSWFMSGAQKSQIELKKGGACLLEFSGNPDRGRGKLLWLATPSMLRKLD
jgi:phosphohistidine phosphatase